MTKTNNKFLLPGLMIVGASLGFIIGGAWGEHFSDPSWGFFWAFIGLLGELFLNVLKAIVIPLIVCSMIVGVASMGDVRKIGGTFGLAVGYYMLTTFVAVIIGLILVNAFQPGAQMVTEGFTAPAREVGPWYEALFDVFRGMFPSNLFAEAAKGKALGLIVFSLIFGAILTTLGKKGQEFVEICNTVNNALLRLVRIIIWAAPIGVMGIVAARIGEAGGGAATWLELARLGKYFLTVLSGLSVHAFIVLPLILFFWAKRTPLKYAGHYTEALLTAFSTASSAATLPITMRDSRLKAGLSDEASGFVLPLGATINMDGTALYEAVAVIFIAQAYGIELSGVHMVLVALTATLAAVGAAAIPEAGLVTMVLVLTTVNVPIEGIGLLLSIDWLLDRFRTTVNVWGDTVGAAVVDRRISKSKAESSK
jgi:Na+/H+-dicarboxylate symporter